MSNNQQGGFVDIDALMQNSWLQVISLRHQPQFKEGEGKALWQRCVADIKQVQQVLRDAGTGDESRQDILLAHCALLDEAVKGRGVQDDACMQWYHLPLQGHFLHSIDAGETLCDRMWQVLRQPTADALVLMCFHRVMLLGFLGGYPSLQAAERQELVSALNARVPPYKHTTEQFLLTGTEGSLQRRIVSHWPVRLGLSALLLLAVWWGLDRWLDQLIVVLLPEVTG
ncbi:type VI secretion system protein TssL, short form [Pantoea sp. At-9b]|uniref:type VI secretion system protein TssL, short form n=1 Tax=Pantoea sp. (strain At-9b) TaxID=592316 RepID=UPI0001B3F546|nr:type VI secretion system protein TssL, short form [Pantoea sp. At-9b]ADU70753.1 type IV / VI secretion system protein, DotU family [Pantoea sp. At-9b]